MQNMWTLRSDYAAIYLSSPLVVDILVVSGFSPFNIFIAAVNMLVLYMIILNPGLQYRSIMNEL